jgi:2-polyprenyl-6-methoxyphenol hydroxylase-like FAD-dependent oxidoreductase
VLETLRADDDGGDGFISEIEILRGDLSRVLYDDTRDGVEYIFGDRIAELTQDADGVDVTFAGGGRRRFDLVVGADGLHSALRAMVFGPHERFLRHLGRVMSFYTVPNEFGLDRWLIDYQESGSGRSAGLRPIQDATQGMAMFSFPAADLDVDYRDVVAQKRLLREQMAGLGWLAPRILAHLDDTPDFYLDQVAQVVMDRWSSGRVGLLGDAAFSSSPLSGQGTGLALVGAYLLAGELAAAGWDPAAGFAGYERRMRSFVEANQEIGRLHARSLGAPGPDAEPSPDFASEGFTDLIERAINGAELPDYAEVPDSGTRVGLSGGFEGDAGGGLEDGHDGVHEVGAEVLDGQDGPDRLLAVHQAALIAEGPDHETGDLAGPLGGDRRREVGEYRDDVPDAPGDAGVDHDGVPGVPHEPGMVDRRGCRSDTARRSGSGARSPG